MLKIIPPQQFKTIPWKNGKGETCELAINEGGTLDDFDWRISIAGVVEDGLFSDFSGYWRNLVLIEGNGIALVHDSDHEKEAKQSTDALKSLLNVATFDGSCKTHGRLMDGPIKDFNVITKISKYKTTVTTYNTPKAVELPSCEHCFIFSLDGEIKLSCTPTILPQGHLLHICSVDKLDANVVTVTGQSLIIACLTLV
ncbi:MAG: HutD family protein [Algicola sp.]|nr:HutD family protein [Algicola sp.]